MYPQHARLLWYASYFGLFVLALVVTFVAHCSKPAGTRKRCCQRDPDWAFVTLPTQCGPNDGALVALGIMAFLAAVLQAIVFFFMRVNLVTIYLLIAYNFANWGWPLSVWAGRFFKGCQAICVGAGVAMMWAATGYETAMLAMKSPAPDTGVSLSMLYALSLCSFVDFMLYVVYPYCWCCGVRINEKTLRSTILDTKSGTDEPVQMRYSIDDADDNESDITEM